MGTRYFVEVRCPNCGFVDEAYYAPTCGFEDWECPQCGARYHINMGFYLAPIESDECGDSNERDGGDDAGGDG